MNWSDHEQGIKVYILKDDTKIDKKYNIRRLSRLNVNNISAGWSHLHHDRIKDLTFAAKTLIPQTFYKIFRSTQQYIISWKDTDIFARNWSLQNKRIRDAPETNVVGNSFSRRPEV